MIGRKRAFAIGCVIYGCGSFTTALAPSLEVLLFGWSFLEGIGAALILPAIVALVAGNFAVERRPAAYGLVAAAGAVAIAVGPLIGGFSRPTSPGAGFSPAKSCSCSSSCFSPAGSPTRRPSERPQLDVVGAVLSALGLGAARLRRPPLGRVGLVQPKPGRPLLGRVVADGLADPGRTVRDLALLPLGGPAGVTG